MPSGTSGSSTNSRYASSITTSTSGGTPSSSPRSSSACSGVPVGLFGVHANTSRVAGVIAASIASVSSRYPSVSGTWTARAPTTWVRIGYASNDRQPYTTSSDGVHVAWSSCWHSVTDPQPTDNWSSPTPKRCASRVTSAPAPLSG